MVNVILTGLAACLALFLSYYAIQPAANPFLTIVTGVYCVAAAIWIGYLLSKEL